MTLFDSFVPIANNLGTIVVAMVAIEIESFFFFFSIVDVSKSRDFINDDVQKEVMV
jgi:hypothetical protein